MRDAPEPLDHAAALDDHAGRAARDTPEMSAIGAARISGHGVATTSTASARTGSPDTAQATPATSAVTRQEDDRVPVGHAHERRRCVSGLSHEPDDRRVRALGRRPRDAQLEGVAGVGRAAADRLARARGRPAATRR